MRAGRPRNLKNNARWMARGSKKNKTKTKPETVDGFHPADKNHDGIIDIREWRYYKAECLGKRVVDIFIILFLLDALYLLIKSST
jgi:hypothetical protein